MLVNDGKMSVWSYSHFTIIDKQSTNINEHFTIINEQFTLINEHFTMRNCTDCTIQILLVTLYDRASTMCASKKSSFQQDQLIVTIYTLSFYSSVHIQLFRRFRTLLRHTLYLMNYYENYGDCSAKASYPIRTWVFQSKLFL